MPGIQTGLTGLLFVSKYTARFISGILVLWRVHPFLAGAVWRRASISPRSRGHTHRRREQRFAFNSLLSVLALSPALRSPSAMFSSLFFPGLRRPPGLERAPGPVSETTASAVSDSKVNSTAAPLAGSSLRLSAYFPFLKKSPSSGFVQVSCSRDVCSTG